MRTPRYFGLFVIHKRETQTRRGDSHAHPEKTEAACDTIFVRAPVSNFSWAREGFTLAFEFDVSNFGAGVGLLS